MATVGRGILHTNVFEVFEGLRTFDAARACAPLADNATVHTPWTGTVHGKAAAQEALEKVLATPDRPSMTIMDVKGDGNIVTLTVSVSGRMGRFPKHMQMQCLCLRGDVHQVVLQ